ncbi:hypothetical protein EVAR_43500_1 [Eumeta japonica]|uniref:Uncharacterized protein n=1 Tax=Eumeta variegata TaxID=151549 RepID=A0A4C1YKS5_EUMVA|nr:hypothetical protein EVAR_43500_1 [Eumeta japonica]
MTPRSSCGRKKCIASSRGERIPTSGAHTGARGRRGAGAGGAAAIRTRRGEVENVTVEPYPRVQACNLCEVISAPDTSAGDRPKTQFVASDKFTLKRWRGETSVRSYSAGLWARSGEQ